MTDGSLPRLPHLVFPTPGIASRRNLGGGETDIRYPSRARQLQRVGPQIASLEAAFDRRRVDLRTDVSGLVPEEMVVLETVGRIEDFLTAVRGIRGLEWMGDFDIAEAAADEDFLRDSESAEPLPGRIYLVLANQHGLRELERLWRTYQENPENPTFARGRTKWRDLFDQLRSIRAWSPEDRIRATGLADELEDAVQGDREIVSLEIELWFRGNDAQRRRSATVVRRMVEEALGRAISESSIPEIRYHAVLAEMPLSAARDIARDRGSPLIRAVEVLHIRPVGQAITDLGEPEPIDDRYGPSPPIQDPRPPVLAMLDGLPMQNHDRLAGRLIVDDPDNWESQYPVASRQHGTAMASLVAHGDLSAGGPALTRSVYVRPVLRPLAARPMEERLPVDLLPVDLIHRAVRRLLDAGGPYARFILAISHAICDPRRPFDREVEAWARLLDYLSWTHNVLFLVPAGNSEPVVSVPVPSSALPGDGSALRDAALRFIVDRGWARRVLAPAESINALTVGSLHADDAGNEPPKGTFDPLPVGSPSLISRDGPGYRRSVKPDIALGGGRTALRIQAASGDSTTLVAYKGPQPPGHAAAAPGSSGETNKMSHIRGTSVATALASRAAVRLADMLEDLEREPGGGTLTRRHRPVLLKALLVHGCRPAVAGTDGLDGIEQTQLDRSLGYGWLDDVDSLLGSTASRATMIGWGTLADGAANVFYIPIPEAVSGVAAARTLTVTLAWFSPVSATHRAYRRASLWFEPYGPDRENDGVVELLDVRRLNSDWQRARRGTTQHEVFVGDRAVVFEPGRRCAIQVNCKSEAEDFTGPVPYGIVVTLDVAAALPIYEQLRVGLRAQVPVPVA